MARETTRHSRRSAWRRTAKGALKLCLAFGLLLALAYAQAPAQPLTLLNEGRKLHAAGKYDEALNLYRRALDLDPKLVDAYLASGIALDFKGNYVEAQRFFSKAIELAPPESQNLALTSMAISFVFDGKVDEASRLYQRVFDTQSATRPGDAAETAYAIGDLYLETGDLPNADKWYRTGYEAAKRQSNLPSEQLDRWEMRWLQAQGRMAARRGDKQRAQMHAAQLRKLVDKGGPNAKGLALYQYLAGYIALYAGDYHTALAELSRADQKDPLILGLLAQAYQKKGDSANARVYSRRVVSAHNHDLVTALVRPKS